MKRSVIPILVFIAVLVSGIWILNRINRPKEEIKIIPTPSVALPTISSDIKVDLTAENNNRVVILKISAIPKDIVSVEYELTYITGSGLPRGVLGKISLSGETEIERKDIVLGTCSSGKCVYDTGVTSIDLSLKFNSPTGMSVYRKTFAL